MLTKPKKMNTQELIQSLPEAFTRQDALKAVIGSGYSVSRLSQILENATHSGIIQRTGRGEYRKIESGVSHLNNV